ncbi:MAG TPA: replication-associated recombination protein A [Saprospiraceae bacterium]|nr:replication-associated recombination protein A [Saprospiraceae bacterium]
MQPLAERMRPQTIDDYIGQSHLLGEKGVLRQVIESGQLPSFILWGPPGVGKTTLALIVAQTLKRPFIQLSAINAGVKDIREAIHKAERQRFFDQGGPILFIDEIHRFSKSQQDALLGAVEKGTVSLIGATTENPSFEVNAALLSRAQVYILEPLRKEDLIYLVEKAIQEDEYLKKKNIHLEENEALLTFSGGDARKLYNILELVAGTIREGQEVRITNELVTQLIQQNIGRYDKSGDQHYDIASAMIKSIRGSDPNAAVYWLARMIEGGEEVKFIARRLMISASEDIGLANPNALLMATTAFQAVQAVGFPEARIILSQAVIYLATSPKSNAAYLAINEAQQTVRKTGNLSVPLPLRNAPTQLMKNLNYGDGYKYAHDFPGNFVDQEFLPKEIKGKAFYQPQKNLSELKILERITKWWKEKYSS